MFQTNNENRHPPKEQQKSDHPLRSLGRRKPNTRIEKQKDSVCRTQTNKTNKQTREREKDLKGPTQTHSEGNQLVTKSISSRQTKDTSTDCETEWEETANNEINNIRGITDLKNMFKLTKSEVKRIDEMVREEKKPSPVLFNNIEHNMPETFEEVVMEKTPTIEKEKESTYWKRRKAR